MDQNLALTTPSPEEDQGGLIQIVQLPIIKERLHKMKALVRERVAYAHSMVVTADNLAEAKKYRAEINALLQRGETERKEAKKAIMQPYTDLEMVYDDCFGDLLKDALQVADSKITPVESGTKEECEQRLRAFFDELIQIDGLDFLKFEQAGITVSMADARAKTQPPKKLREQLENFVARVANDVDTISTMEDAGEIMAVYKQSLSVADALQTVKERKRQIIQAQEENERRNAVRAQETEARRKVEAFAPPTVSETEKVENLLTCTFTVTDTRDRLKLLKQFLDASGYKYES